MVFLYRLADLPIGVALEVQKVGVGPNLNHLADLFLERQFFKRFFRPFVPIRSKLNWACLRELFLLGKNRNDEQESYEQSAEPRIRHGWKITENRQASWN